MGHLDTIISSLHGNVISNIFTQLSKEYPNSPIILFSQIAQGVGMEVARIFLRIEESANNDFQLIIPLLYEEREFTSKLTDEEKNSSKTLFRKPKSLYN